MPLLVSRRGFLLRAGLGAGAVVVATACTSNERTRRTDANPVVVANHPLYIDASTNPGFTAATGTTVEYHEEVGDDDTWLAEVRPHLEKGETIDRDVVIVSDWAADRLERHSWLTPIAHVTWALGMLGIAYDVKADEVKAVGGHLTSAAQLFQPALRGRVALPTDMRSTLGIALLADRVDPSLVSVEAATATAGRLINSVRVKQILPLDGSRPIDHLVAGEVAAAVVRASDTVGLEGDHPDLRFVVAEEGGLLFTDVAVVPVHGANPSGAAAYLDYVSAPVNAAALSGRAGDVACWSHRRVASSRRAGGGGGSPSQSAAGRAGAVARLPLARRPRGADLHRIVRERRARR